MKSDFSVGLADKLCGVWDGEGGTPVELNNFAENEALVRGVLAIIRGQAVVKPVQSASESVETPMPAPFQFKVARTIKLGLHKTPAEYRKALKDAKVEIGVYAGQILDKITIAKEVIEVDISEPFTVADLGYTLGTTRYDVIKKRIVECGGELCPNEAGPADRLQNLDQPKGDWYRTAMEALTGSDDDLSVFYLGRHGDGLRLYGHYSNVSTLYYPDDRFVCVVPRKK